MNEAGRFVCRREGSLSVWRCFVVLVVSGVLTGFAQAQEESYTRIVERWECKTFAGVLTDTGGITLTRGELDDAHVGEGEVSVAEITYRAVFRMVGLRRRWDFGEDWDYAFFVDPDGTGAYIDFSGVEPGESAAASEMYRCKLIGAGEEAADKEAEKAEEAVPIVRVVPEYPPEALMDGIEGFVEMELLVGPDGSVLEIRVTDAAPGRLFVRNAIRAVRRWKYTPHIVSGEAVERWVKAREVFELDD
ncbi:MAG: energy transducer TonB [Gammaproteobacteria bacterium]|nr:energy transducer TonB [Gammaproteobacteria bacterium]